MKLLQLLAPDELRQVDTVALGPKLNLGSPPALTVTTNAVTITNSWHQLSASGTSSQRQLRTINGGVTGDLLILTKAASSPGDVVIDDNVGNIQASGDFTLSNPADTIMFLFDGSQWIELGRSNNA